MTAICGPNGAGKSTLLQCLAGLLAAGHAARFSLDGAPLATLHPRRRARAIGYLPQDGRDRVGLVGAQPRRARAAAARRPRRSASRCGAGRARPRTILKSPGQHACPEGKRPARCWPGCSPESRAGSSPTSRSPRSTSAISSPLSATCARRRESGRGGGAGAARPRAGDEPRRPRAGARPGPARRRWRARSRASIRR